MIEKNGSFLLSCRLYDKWWWFIKKILFDNRYQVKADINVRLLENLIVIYFYIVSNRDLNHLKFNWKKCWELA